MKVSVCSGSKWKFKKQNQSFTTDGWRSAAVSPITLGTMIMRNHEYLWIVAKLTGTSFGTSYCTPWTKSQPRALPPLKFRHSSGLGYVPNTVAAQLSHSRCFHSPGPSLRWDSTLGREVYKDRQDRPWVILYMKDDRVLGCAFIQGLRGPCSVTLTRVWQGPRMWPGSEIWPGPGI